ncbi:MAG: hypothetical protein Unbinned400contig1000_25 [Prokaryotic dsDNA virus sp.]|nr:MAG: hypothetical protein Unbinned400contig1000_25 [Prokaryotic dsDNA virus sp.]|tara:strand:+ start:14606 stop:18238 length:3633 start_codon:yes stop_codon:yes gene_type:complete
MPTGRQIALHPWDKGMDLLSEESQMPTGFTREVNNVTFNFGRFAKRPGYAKRRGSLTGVVTDLNLLANGSFLDWDDTPDDPDDWTLAGETSGTAEVSEVAFDELYGGTGNDAANFYSTVPTTLSISQNITSGITATNTYRFQAIVSEHGGGRGKLTITDNASVVLEQMLLDRVGVFTTSFVATTAAATSVTVKLEVNNTSESVITDFTVNEISVKETDTTVVPDRGFNLVKTPDFKAQWSQQAPIVVPTGSWTSIGSRTGSDLITNGGFENEPLDGWSVVGTGTIARNTTVLHTTGVLNSSTGSGLLQVSAADDGVKSSTFTTANDGVYMITGWVYPVDITSIQVLVRNGNDTVDLYDQSHTLTANVWNRIVVVFVEGAASGGANAYIQFDAGTRTSGSWYLDDIEVYKQGTAQDWTATGGATAVMISTGHPDRPGAFVTQQFTATTADDGIESDTFSLTSGTYYMLTVVYVPPSDEVSIAVRKGDDAGDEFDEALTGLTANTWAFYRKIFSATATGSSGKITIDSSTETSGTWYVSHVQLLALDNDTDWTFGSGWSWDGSEADATTSSADLEQTLSDLKAGTKYIVDYTVRGLSAGSVQPTLGGTAGTSRSTTGTNSYTEFITTPATLTDSKIKFTGTGFSGAIDNVGVYETSTSVGQFDGFTGDIEGELITGIKSFQDAGGNFVEAVFTNKHSLVHDPNTGEFHSLFELADTEERIQMFRTTLPSYMSMALVPDTTTAQPKLYFTNGLPFESSDSLDHTLYFTEGKLTTAETEDEVRANARINVDWFIDEGNFLGAKQIAYYHDHLVCANYNIDGTWFRNRIVWGDLLQDDFSKRQGDAGDQGSYILADARGELLRLIKLGDHMAIYFDRSIVIMDPIPTTAIWSFDTRVQGTGLLGPNAVTDIGGVHIFAGQDNVFLYDGGLHPRPIGDRIIQRFLGTIDARKKDRIVAQHIPERDQVIFYLPTVSTEYGKVAFMYHYLRDTWTHWELGDEVSAVGTARRGGTLVTGLDDDGNPADDNTPSPLCLRVSDWPPNEDGTCRTVEQMFPAPCDDQGGARLNEVEFTGGGFGPVMGTASGKYIDQSNLTGDDAGVPFSAFVETDMKPLGSSTGSFDQRGVAYGEFGRINEIELRYKGGRFTLSYKVEEDEPWQQIKTFAKQDNPSVIRHPFDLVARFIAFRIDIPEDSYNTEISVLSITVRPWGSRHLDGN